MLEISYEPQIAVTTGGPELTMLLPNRIGHKANSEHISKDDKLQMIIVNSNKQYYTIASSAT